jgi:hypothetical protein
MRIITASIALGVGWLIGATAFADDACKTPPACQEVQTCGSADRCGRCGCRSACEKCCKVVCEMKEVKKTVWVVHCKEFCPPLPARPLCGGNLCSGCGNPCGGCGKCSECQTCTPTETCEACQGGGKCDVCANLQNRNYREPNCGKVREKKTLEKKEVVCKVPSYKCVVEYCCSQCAQPKAAPSEPPPKSVPATPTAAPVPPAPSAPAQQAPLPPSGPVASPNS